MDYILLSPSPQQKAAATMSSDEGCKLLVEDDFLSLDPAWKIHISKAHERSSFENEGKAGEIYTPATTSVFAERALPEGTRLVEATIHAGDDTSASWGPGLALVWPKGIVIFFLRPILSFCSGFQTESKDPAYLAKWKGIADYAHSKGIQIGSYSLLQHYAAMIRSNMGLGVQACYRGPRLYDTDPTRDILKREVAWYNKRWDILESNMIRGRRADGRDLDWMLHVNPKLEEKGYLAVYNSTDREITKTIRVPLYDTGLNRKVTVCKEGGEAAVMTMDADRTIKLQVTVPAQGFGGYLISAPEE